MSIISFVVPSVNNLRYLKNAYTSIRKYAGTNHEIIVLDDGSTDGTLDWLRKLADENLVIWENTTGNRLGHTITYDIGINMAKNEIVTILHADMFIGPNYVENALKHLKKGTVVSATRIEPPLHPEGKEKIVKDFGMWPETFTENEFVSFVHKEQERSGGNITRGIFAPWFIYKEDFLHIGGHDPLFAPFPYEDSDIFQRFLLAGYTLVQSRDALVYHLTCRGHKWTDDKVIGKTDSFFDRSELRARKNYIRKWNSWIKNDEYHHPIVQSKYHITGVLENIKSVEQLEILEPWFSKVIVKNTANASLVENYINVQQRDTLFDMRERVEVSDNINLTNENICVKINLESFNQEDMNAVTQLNSILGELDNTEDNAGNYQLGNLHITVNKIKNITNELIHTQRSFNDYTK